MSANGLLGDWLGQVTLGDGSSPKLDGEGIARLSIGGDFALTIAANEERRVVGIFGTLLPAGDLDAAALRHAMSLNLALAILGNGALAIGENNDVIYVRTAPIDALDAAKFKALLEDSVSQAEGARKAILERGKTVAAAPQDTADAPQESWLRL